MHFLKIGEAVIAFSTMETFDIARCAVASPDHVYHRVGGGYTIYNPETARIINVVKSGVREYKCDIVPTKDAGSLYRICRILLDVRGKHG